MSRIVESLYGKYGLNESLSLKEALTFQDWLDKTFYPGFDTTDLSDEEYYELEDAYYAECNSTDESLTEVRNPENDKINSLLASKPYPSENESLLKEGVDDFPDLQVKHVYSYFLNYPEVEIKNRRGDILYSGRLAVDDGHFPVELKFAYVYGLDLDDDGGLIIIVEE